MASLIGILEGVLPPSMMVRVGPFLAARGRTSGLVAAALGVTVMGLALLWSRDSGYSVLYAGLSGEEGGKTIAELQKLNIPYRITEGGRVIMVPSADTGRARLQLAARGVPKRENDEWALLDNESLGVSPFVEQVHYVRGVETALARTIREVDGVVSAKVTLALPKQSDFLANSPKPSASVLIRLRPSTQLTTAQIDGMVGLVASSVPGLTRDKVTIVDQTGRSLNAHGRDGLHQAPQQLELAREITHRYEALVTDLLVPVLGRGNFRVSADADIDFSQTKESQVKYGASHILSQDEKIHTRPGDGGEAAAGIPGALSNRRPDTPATGSAPPKPASQTAGPQTPETPAAPPAPTGATDSHRTTNYDIDRTVQYLEHPSWKLRSISLAVLINNGSGKPIPATRIQSIQTLVTSAIGAGENPRITVVDLPFEETLTAAGEIAQGWWAEPWMATVGQNALLAVAGVLALFGGVFPLMRRVAAVAVAPGSARAGAGGRGATPRAAAAAGGGSVTQSPEPTMRPQVTSQDVFSIEAETVQTLVANDPARTAQVIRGWIAGDRNSIKQAS